jgi:hypothetical protein
VRDGDTGHGRIDLDQPPGVILISATGKGIVTVSKYGFNNLGPDAGVDDVVIYSLQGKVLHRKNRNALFDEKVRHSFYHGDGYLVWRSGCWIDDRRGEIVIVGGGCGNKAAPRPVLSINLASGAVGPGSTELIDRAISEL